MTWLDYAVIGVLAVSILLGAWRGLVREVISILGLVIAFLASNLFAGPLGAAMPEAIPTPELRVAAAFVAVFFGTLIVTSLLGLVLSKAMHAVGLEGLDLRDEEPVRLCAPQRVDARIAAVPVLALHAVRILPPATRWVASSVSAQSAAPRR